VKKHLIALNIAILTLLIAPYIIQQANASTANAYPYHPTCKVFGKVKKDWYVGRTWKEYRDDQGLSSFLPFNRTNENVTINFHKIVFDNNFENKSIGSGTVTKSVELTLTKDVLTQNDQEYIYLKVTNSSNLSTESTYYARVTLNASKSVTDDDYILFTAYLKKTGDNIADWRIQFILELVDTGATTRYMAFVIHGQVGSDGVSTWSAMADSFSNVVTYSVYGKDATYYTMQMKIGDMLKKAGENWIPSKLTKIHYVIVFTTGTTLDATSTVEVKIKHALILPTKVYIDDPSYENGLIVNGTSGQFTPSAGDIIQIYGANATKIVDVTIPFVYEDTRDFDEICTAIAECYGLQYEWKFILPKSPTTGDKLEYSNTNITLKCWFDGSYVDRLYVNGVDKTTQVSGKKVDTSEGLQDKDRAWTYLVASSLTAGNQYDVELKIKDLPKQIWYDLTTEPTRILTWEWLYDKLLVILAFFSNLLGGIGSSWIKAQREKLRVPKR